MFRKVLSSIGVGGARVDTRLSHETLVPGETVSGETVIEGGDGPQEFERIGRRFLGPEMQSAQQFAWVGA